MATKQPTGRVTLRDVAEASGVARSTASFVLNDVPTQSISEATRLRVREAAERLGYVPNGIARALNEGTSRIVVLNIDRTKEGSYSQDFIRGLDRELAVHGYVLLVRHGHQTPGGIKQVLDVIAPRAVINFQDSYLDGHELEDSGGGWKSGMAAGVLVQLRFLTQRGHTRIGLALPADEPLADLRHRFADEVTSMLEVPDVVRLDVPVVAEETTSALREFLTRHPDLTAVAAFNDDTALCLLRAAHELGVRVPADLAVIGYDDSRQARTSIPSLTTVHVAAETHGRVNARLALGLDASDINNELGQVVERESA